MKFNHLLTEKERLQFCKNRNPSVCKWKPVSEGYATVGDNIRVSMLCEKCGSRTEKFLSYDNYQMSSQYGQERLKSSRAG